MADLDWRVKAIDALRRRTGGSIATMDLADIPAAREDRLPDAPLVRPVVEAFGGWLFGRPHPQVVTSRATVAGAVGPLPLRLHHPAADPATRGLIVHLHGGGWVLGRPDGYDWLCSHLAHALGAVVASVDYRMAPEDPAPAAVDDAIAATAALAAAPALVGARADAPVVVAGDSAGGNLAALVAIAARDGAVPPLAGQALIYPATDLTRSSPSMQRLTHEPLLSRADIDRFVALYLAGGVAPDDPRVSPAAVEDLSGLASALVQTAEHDPLVDEGVAYAARLQAAGVPTRQTTYVGVPHGFQSIPGVCPAATQALAELVDWMRPLLSADRS
ncbi:MAG: alpha/beta hydrolase [Nitriliruptoraceae bacterium]|nr:alpha/beta hydrolase [Nitriliruptoraceae bacterium]